MSRSEKKASTDDKTLQGEITAAFASASGKAGDGVDVMVHTEIGEDRRTIVIHVKNFLQRLHKLDPDSPDCSEIKAELDALDEKREWLHGQFRGREVPRLIRWHQESGFGYKFSNAWHGTHPITPAVEQLRLKLQRDLTRRLRPILLRYGLDFDLNSVLINKYRHGNDSVSKHADSEAAFGPNPSIVSISCGAARPFELMHMDDGEREAAWQSRRAKLDALKKHALEQIKSGQRKKRDTARWETMADIIDESLALIPEGLVTPKGTPKPKRLTLLLGNGDMVIMAGACQDYWLHEVEKITATGKKGKKQTEAAARRVPVRYNLTYRPFILPAEKHHKFAEAPSQWLRATRAELEAAVAKPRNHKPRKAGHHFRCTCQPPRGHPHHGTSS